MEHLVLAFFRWKQKKFLTIKFRGGFVEVLSYFSDYQIHISKKSFFVELTELPKEIGNLINLQGLSVFGNKLTELPTEIGNLINLQKLYVYNNNLTELPKLPYSLTFLDCETNHLSSLPELPFSLTTLRCENNKILSLPELPNQLKEL